MKSQNNNTESIKKSIIRILKNNKFIYSNLLYFKYIILKNKCYKKRKTNIFMLHIGRVGSTVLADLLNQHSEIYWDGEFYPKQTKNYLKLLYKNPVKLLKIKMSQKVSNYYGFELKTSYKQLYGHHSINMDIDKFLDKIEKLNYNNFILLKRRNYLRQFISFQFAKKTKIHHTKKNVKKSETLTINTDSCILFKETKPLIKHFEYFDNYYLSIEKLLESKNLLSLTYEDDILPNPSIAYKKICNFLKIEPENPKINLKRTNPFPVKEVVENFEEVAKVLKGTKYEWMLYE